MERFHLWSLFLQLLVVLYPNDGLSERVEMVLHDAAEDSALDVLSYAKLLRLSDRLLGR